jgi:hypothetical protein
VLKKAGIVVATVTAGLLAMSPLAFAGDHGDHGKHDKGHHGSVKNVDIENNSADCDFNNTNTTNVSQDAEAVAFALVGAVANIIQVGQGVNIPINANVPLLSCNNVHFEDNDEDNSRAVQGSFNEN